MRDSFNYQTDLRNIEANWDCLHVLTMIQSRMTALARLQENHYSQQEAIADLLSDAIDAQQYLTDIVDTLKGLRNQGGLQ